ncbi:MAG: carboxypeptidase-like regulatory domain-containing protein [Bacteroidales bacterium]|jgi:hypothetical protein
MSATNSSADKYLFLFTTDSDNITDIQAALQDYYKFPAGNTFSATGCANFISTYKTMIETLAGTDPTAPVYKMPDPAGLVPAGETNMNTVFVVISGEADVNGLIDPVSGQLTWQQVRQTIFGTIPQPVGPPKTYPYQQYAEIHVVFVSPYCNAFIAEWDTNVPVTNGTLIIPQTVSDAINQADRESFLSQLAGELKLDTSTMIDDYGRISVNDIAASVHGASVSSYFRSVGAGVAGKYFAGYSRLEIDDGSPDWWESQDIYINTPGNDLYNQGTTNTCYIQVHARGTHPVKTFWIGAKHFGTGLGAADALILGNPTVPDATLPAVLKATETCTYSYVLNFLSTTTHRCICARAHYTQILSTEIDDYSEWSIVANPDEAQRNLDPAPSGAPHPPLPMPEPKPAQNPDPDPQMGIGDQFNPGDHTLQNIRGLKEHIYYILNTFRDRRIFRLSLHTEFEKYAKMVKVDFYSIRGGDAATAELLTIIPKPYPHIDFVLESREKKEIMVRIHLQPEVNLHKELRLPLEILMERKGLKVHNLRTTNLVRLDPAFTALGGVTIKVWSQPLNIKGRVLDQYGKPVAGACVIIRSVNGMQASILKTDKKGNYMMQNINPDSYRMSASTKEWHTAYIIVDLVKRSQIIDFRQPK